VTGEPRRPREISDPIGQAIRATAERVEAPAGLRERIAQGGAGAGAPPRRRPWRRLWARVLGGAAVVAAVVVVALLAGVGAGGPAPLTAANAADVALRAADGPPRPAEGAVPRSVGGVRFPDYDGEWSPTGAARQMLGGHAVTTVRYGDGDSRVSYAIVAGAPLKWPDGELRTTRRGTPVVVFERDGALAVAWRRGGHTCVLATRDTSLRELLEFVDRPA